MSDRISSVPQPAACVRGREGRVCAQAVLGWGQGHPEVIATLRWHYFRRVIWGVGRGISHASNWRRAFPSRYRAKSSLFRDIFLSSPFRLPG